MYSATVTTGDICVGQILSKKLQRDILPNDGGSYRRAREQEDKFRFISFMRTEEAASIYDCLGEPFEPDGLSTGLGFKLD